MHHRIKSDPWEESRAERGGLRSLASSIEAGDLPLGSRLPPEDSLIARFSVSRTTIRTTIQNLKYPRFGHKAVPTWWNQLP
jgi:DNA-binding FadR family transcriptional regulator